MKYNASTVIYISVLKVSTTISHSCQHWHKVRFTRKHDGRKLFVLFSVKKKGPSTEPPYRFIRFIRSPVYKFIVGSSVGCEGIPVEEKRKR